MSRSLSHQVVVLMIGRLIAYAVMIFTPVINTRALSVHDYGYYRQFWLIFETLSPMLILGFPRSLLYYFPRAADDREKSVYITQTLVFLTTGSMVAIAIYTVMGNVLGAGMGALVRSFYVRLCFFTLFMIVSEYMESLFVAERQAKRQAIYHSTVAVTQAIVVMTTAWFSRDVSSVIWALSIFATLKFLFAIGYTYFNYRPSLALVSLSTIRKQLSFALPLGLLSMTVVLIAQSDKFIINRFLGREAFAIYVIGAFQLPFVNIIRGSVTNVTFPLMAKYQRDEDYASILELWQKSLIKTSVLFYPLFVLFEVVAYPFIIIMFKETYAGAVPIFMIYLLLFLRSSVEASNIMQVFNRMKYLVIIQACAFVFNVAVSIALFQLIGREGVPLGTVITLYLVNTINLVYASRLLKARFLDVYPLLALARRFLVAVLPGVGMWALLRRYPVDNIFELVGVGALYFVVYFVICSWAGYIKPGDLKALFGKPTL